METLGWIVYGILLLLTLSLTFGAIKTINKGVSYATIIQTVVFWILLIFFFITEDVNRLNLLWIAPLLFIIIGFIVPIFIIRKTKQT